MSHLVEFVLHLQRCISARQGLPKRGSSPQKELSFHFNQIITHYHFKQSDCNHFLKFKLWEIRGQCNSEIKRKKKKKKAWSWGLSELHNGKHGFENDTCRPSVFWLLVYLETAIIYAKQRNLAGPDHMQLFKSGPKAYAL